jgi:FAD:protein FMN transferase
MSADAEAEAEASAEFDCFGATCTALVTGPGDAGSAQQAVAMARRTLLAWHERFSRFLPNSELSRLNSDPRGEVPVSALMARLADAVRTAASISGGLVDATLVSEIEDAGYRGELPAPLPLAQALTLAPPREAAAGAPAARWRQLEVDIDAGTLTRPPGLKLDSGGLAKGLFADVLGEALVSHVGFAVNCAGDLLLGGASALRRPVRVQSPFDEQILHTFNLSAGGVATSGISRRSWLQPAGAPAHHLLDPASGRPAFTGIVQATALAPSALLAEIRAKAAVLSGPDRALRWLPDGGVLVFDDGSHHVIQPPAVVTLSQLSGFLDGARKRARQAA